MQSDKGCEMSELTLRPWQAQALQKAESWLVDNGNRHFLINAAPGAGKTICASVIAKQMFKRDVIDRVIVIAPRSEVVKQWGKDFQFVTGKHMTKVTASDEDVTDYGNDLCATWHAIEGLSEPFQFVCNNYRTLVICDEHHHAAVEAAWGEQAGSAFENAKYTLILTGTPVRSDGKDTVWLAYDDEGNIIDLPDDASFTLTYGEAVDRGYCRPITFHRHEGNFTVTLPDGDGISVSSKVGAEDATKYSDVPGLKRALDFFKLAVTPKYETDGITPDPESYLGSMAAWGIDKLEDLRETVPTAGGLVIAPTISIAEYIAELLEVMTDEKPLVVHNNSANPEGRIAAFRNNTDKKWLVSVAMISEGVDIPRLRVLFYVPHAKTELAFRQSMGRVVRTLGPDDYSRAYVVMPSLEILEEYARKVEQEMSPQARKEKEVVFKVCPICETQNPRNAKSCSECGHEFPQRKTNYRSCPNCEGLNPKSASSCQHCGQKFSTEFEVSLKEALRVGAIVRGMDIDEEDVQESEEMAEDFREFVLKSGDENLLRIMRDLPAEALTRLTQFAEARKRSKES
jgi:superfamily II DNA or RNA helicase|tara:strand:+ start:1292 stop:3001 length:1710 start_codon:yes stop_codon:yes gene_type:complete